MEVKVTTSPSLISAPVVLLKTLSAVFATGSGVVWASSLLQLIAVITANKRNTIFFLVFNLIIQLLFF